MSNNSSEEKKFGTFSEWLDAMGFKRSEVKRPTARWADPGKMGRIVARRFAKKIVKTEGNSQI